MLRKVLAVGLCLVVGGCCCGRSDWTHYAVRPDPAGPSAESDTQLLREVAELAAETVGGFSDRSHQADLAFLAVRPGAAESSPETIVIRVAHASDDPFVEIQHVHGGSRRTRYYRCHPVYARLQTALTVALRSRFAERLVIVSRVDVCTTTRPDQPLRSASPAPGVPAGNEER